MDTMPSTPPAPIAVVADAHFHDIYGDYGFDGIMHDERRLTLRPLADTARSTRVFNESYFALHHTLDSIAGRGIRHVVLLGDYSDDGQVETVRGVARVLDLYRKRFGMRFYATVGNHDIFGSSGRHRTKRVLNEDGSHSVISSDPAMRDVSARSVATSEALYCRGYPDGLDTMAGCGFFPDPDYLHWETPFGSNGDPARRTYAVSSPDGKTVRSLMDASYLVEPFDGVWLLMIDANVFVPVDGVAPGQPGDLTDSTGAGWNALLHHKPFILDWVRDVTARARLLGKTVLAFSHYPVLDPLDGTGAAEVALLGRTSMSERIPVPAVADALIEAGIGIHFSGHLHVNDTASYRRADRSLVNIAVPSLVAFPAAYKVVSMGAGHVDIETVGVGDMKHQPVLGQAYGREIAQSGLKPGRMLDTVDYGGFLSEHLGHLAGRRYLKREWPKDLAAVFRKLDLSDLAILALIKKPVVDGRVAEAIMAVRTRPAQILKATGIDPDAFSAIPAIDFLGDWYRLRMGSEIALDWIDKERIALYQAVSALYRAGNWSGGQSAQGRFAMIFRMFDSYLCGLPSRDFRVDCATGVVTAAQSADRGSSPTG